MAPERARAPGRRHGRRISAKGRRVTVSSSADCGRRPVATTERHWASARGGRTLRPSSSRCERSAARAQLVGHQQRHAGVPMALASAAVTALHGWLPLLSNSEGGTAAAVLGGEGSGFQASASSRVTTCGCRRRPAPSRRRVRVRRFGRPPSPRRGPRAGRGRPGRRRGRPGTRPARGRRPPGAPGSAAAGQRFRRVRARKDVRSALRPPTLQRARRGHVAVSPGRCLRRFVAEPRPYLPRPPGWRGRETAAGRATALVSPSAVAGGTQPTVERACGRLDRWAAAN